LLLPRVLRRSGCSVFFFFLRQRQAAAAKEQENRPHKKNKRAFYIALPPASNGGMGNGNEVKSAFLRQIRGGLMQQNAR
jgi:hypothetical protein